MMQTVNERLRDESIAHAVWISRYSTGVAARMVKTLNDSDAELTARLLVALDSLDPGSFTVTRLESLLASVREVNRAAINSMFNRWFSVMAGPSVRVNEWFSAYAMAGVAYSRVSTFSGDYLRVTDNKGKTHDVLTGSDDGRHSNTSLAWGAGVQFNPTESVVIDVAYEGSGSGDWRTDGFIVGVGYKF